MVKVKTICSKPLITFGLKKCLINVNPSELNLCIWEWNSWSVNCTSHLLKRNMMLSVICNCQSESNNVDNFVWWLLIFPYFWMTFTNVLTYWIVRLSSQNRTFGLIKQSSWHDRTHILRTLTEMIEWDKYPRLDKQFCFEKITLLFNKKSTEWEIYTIWTYIWYANEKQKTTLTISDIVLKNQKVVD